MGALKCAIYAVLNMHINKNDLGDNAPLAPTVPKLGNDCVLDNCDRNLPDGTAYVPPKYRIPIASEVYAIPIIPNNENGANDDKFFTKHNGSNTVVVNPSIAVDRDMLIPNIPINRSLIVSPNTILYVKLPAKQSNADESATIHEDFVPRVTSHASEYDVAPVILQILAIKLNVYPDIVPIIVINAIAGSNAPALLPNAAIPAGKLKTPAPIILFTKLNISFDIVAVPPPPPLLVVPFALSPPPPRVFKITSFVVQDEDNGVQNRTTS